MGGDFCLTRGCACRARLWLELYAPVTAWHRLPTAAQITAPCFLRPIKHGHDAPARIIHAGARLRRTPECACGAQVARSAITATCAQSALAMNNPDQGTVLAAERQASTRTHDAAHKNATGR
jgi:hypothetical protein